MLLGVWLLYFCFGLSVTSLAPLVTPVTRDLQMSHAAMGMVLGGWQIVYIFSAVPCGTLLDRLGPRRALFIGAVIMALSGIGRSLAVDHVTMLLAVGLFGLGGPIISAGAPKVVTQWFQGRERGLAMGIYITGPALGGIVALTSINGLLMPLFGQDWRMVLVLFSMVTLAVAVVWLLLTRHPDSADMERRLSATPRVSQWLILGTLGRLPAVQIVLAMSVGIFFLNHGLNNWLPELLGKNGLSPADAGLWAAIPTAIGIAGSLLIPRLATAERRHLILFLLCLAAALASLCLHAAPGGWLLFGLILHGFARSSLMTVMILLLVELPGVGERYAGTASGLFFSAAEIGGVAGPVMFGVVYDVTGSFTLALYILTAVALALGAGVLVLRRLQS